LGIPAEILPEIVAAVKLGTAARMWPRQAACTRRRLFAAAATIPHRRRFRPRGRSASGWCFISPGTWSLMGVELDSPVIGERARALIFTNEIGVEGKVRLLKNIMGMWPLQECRRAWEAEGHVFSYAELTERASVAPPFHAVVDPDAFLEPGHMPERIAAWAREHGEAAPQDVGTFTRVILESLALRYRQVMEILRTHRPRASKPSTLSAAGRRTRC
jgi:rhamnulokinase